MNPIIIYKTIVNACAGLATGRVRKIPNLGWTLDLNFEGTPNFCIAFLFHEDRLYLGNAFCEEFFICTADDPQLFDKVEQKIVASRSYCEKIAAKWNTPTPT